MESDKILENIVHDVVKRKGDTIKDIKISTPPILPVPSFAFRYLINSTGFPLGMCHQIVGEQASYKSTFAMEIGRWHRMCGGSILYLESESKPSPEMLSSVVNWDKNAFVAISCPSLDKWQSYCIWITKKLISQFEDNYPPYCIIVDSISGKTDETTIKTTLRDGCAGMHFPREANLIKTFLQIYPNLIESLPFSFIGVNHLKIHRNPDGSVNYNIPGGGALKFQCVSIIEMAKIGQIKEYAKSKVVPIMMSLIKNSYGPDNRKLAINFRTWNEDGVLRSRFEWWEASVRLLAKNIGMTQANAAIWRPAIREVCDLREKHGGPKGTLYWSKRLDVPSSEAMPAHEIGMLLETRPDVLDDLYRLFGIHRRPLFQPAVDVLSKVPDYAYIKEQARYLNELQNRDSGDSESSGDENSASEDSGQ